MMTSTTPCSASHLSTWPGILLVSSILTPLPAISFLAPSLVVLFLSLLVCSVFQDAIVSPGLMLIFDIAPFELAKLQAQLAGKVSREGPNKGKPSAGTWASLHAMYRQRGLLSLWKGFHLHLCKFKSHVAAPSAC